MSVPALPRFFNVVIAATVLLAPPLSAKARRPAEFEAATRLQVFLDRADFAPGRIDGRYGDFTLKALALYRQSLGGTRESAPVPATPPKKPRSNGGKSPVDTSGLDLSSVDAVFVSYTVTAADLENVGEIPSGVPAQAKLKWLPYKDAAEAIAEKFHCDVRFLAELNPTLTQGLKAGDQLQVPNVLPFEIANVKSLKPGSEFGPPANVDFKPDPEIGEAKEKAEPSPRGSEPRPMVSVKVDVKTNMVAVYQGEQVVAAYPVTIGSGQTESPIGDWKVKGVAKLPTFRYDKQMLEHGERSADFHMLPPGPNSPVGVIWIALDRKGIGLHGTSEPDSIGRSVSHGCIRLANWDIVRLAARVKGGVPVSIH